MRRQAANNEGFLAASADLSWLSILKVAFAGGPDCSATGRRPRAISQLRVRPPGDGAVMGQEGGATRKGCMDGLGKKVGLARAGRVVGQRDEGRGRGLGARRGLAGDDQGSWMLVFSEK